MASTKYEKVKDVLIPALREGMPKRQAAALCGIHRDTLYGWLEKAKDGDKNYKDISDTIKKAQAEFVRDRLKSIKKHGESQFQADAWLLERMFPEDFAKLDKLAMTDPTGKNEYTGTKESNAELAQRVDRFLAGIPESGASNGHTKIKPGLKE